MLGLLSIQRTGRSKLLLWISMAVALVGCKGMSQGSLPLETALLMPAATQTALEAPSTPTEAAGKAVLSTQVPPMRPEIPDPSATPVPQMRALTGGGCCVQPFWSPDSQQVLYMDKPVSGSPAGLWGVGVDGGAPWLVNSTYGIFSPGLNYRLYLADGLTMVERLQDGQRWEIPSGGRQVYFSPDEAWLAWTSGENAAELDAPRRAVWISRVDGSQVQKINSSGSLSFAGWLPEQKILAAGQAEDNSGNQVLSVLSIPAEPGAPAVAFEVARGPRLRSPALSPDGKWLAYFVTFSEMEETNGLWLANTQTAEKRRLPLFGAFRWRNAQNLLIIPMDLSSPFHRIWQVNAAGGEAEPLTDPAVTPLKIAGGDWQVSPDGRWVAFVSAVDRNIWVLNLP